MDFREVEKSVQELKAKADAGEIDARVFEAELRKLQVLDEQGRYWMIGAQSGQWYYYDGTQWVQSEPPEAAVPIPTETAPPKPPSPPPSIHRSAGTAGGRTDGTLSRLAIPMAAALVALCCMLAGASVVASEFILPNRPLSSFVTGLIQRTPSTPSPVVTPQPSVTVGVSAEEYIRLGDELFNEGRYQEAIAQYRMAISAEPQRPEAYARLGQAYVQLDSCDQAIPEFQQALALDPELESAQAGLMECGGPLPPDVSFTTYRRSDLNLSLLYPGSWFVQEEELQTIFAEREEDIDFLRGNVFFISSIPLAEDEQGMDTMGALIKARQLINLPVGSQLGGVEIESLAGWEWATVRGEVTGLQEPTTIYVAATVKGPRWYGIWAIGPSETWEQTSWPIFRVMANSVELGEVVAEASPTAQGSPAVDTPQASPEASPAATPRPATPTPTSPGAASLTPTVAAPTATPKPATLSGKIAYPRYVGGQAHYEIHIADINGQDLNIISGASEPALDLAGNSIAYRSWDPSYRGLVISGIGGGDRERPRGGANPNEDSVPRWAPDGLSLVYATKRFGPHRVSHVMTHLLAQHTEQDLGDADNPDWSNDGQRIVARTVGLVIMDRLGHNREQLTSNPNDFSPDWSPSSNRIAFMRQTGINWDIWVVNSDGSGQTRLTTEGSIDGLPAWSPDGTHIAFLSNRGGVWGIWVMRSDGSNQRKLFNTESGTYATSEGFDGEWAAPNENWQRRDWQDEQISWSR